MFRHAFLTALAAEGVDAETLGAIAGHSSVITTFRHHVQTSFKNMRAAGAISQLLFGLPFEGGSAGDLEEGSPGNP
jgi:integrase